ncbi:MAG: magnesium/cobalt transporter CorA [Kiritimatiellae bacterium]|nr:magnesium/cobalt transporter CorA [Kiritimatiellia bacterium]
MTKLMKQHSKKSGLPPGSLVFVGDQRVETATITVIDYNEADIRETAIETPDDCRPYIGQKTVTWINVTGLHDIALLAQLGNALHIDFLILEDVLNTGQRPRFEDYGDSIFCVVKMLYRGNGDGEVVSEQVSMVLGRGYLVTFQELEGDVFDMIRERIRTGQGRIRTMGCDYLAYALLDAIVDNYFIVIEDIGDKIERLQDAVLEHPQPETMQAMHQLRRETIFMRKHVWPLRELVSSLGKSESSLISKDLGPYLRDIHEHTFQVLDAVEAWREMLSGAMEIYMTRAGNRMNEVMKVLTVIATIFIPLTFIAGIYGMNFENMPELKWRLGYAAVWGVMLCVGLGMAIFFKRKRWW